MKNVSRVPWFQNPAIIQGAFVLIITSHYKQVFRLHMMAGLRHSFASLFRIFVLKSEEKEKDLISTLLTPDENIFLFVVFFGMEKYVPSRRIRRRDVTNWCKTTNLFFSVRGKIWWIFLSFCKPDTINACFYTQWKQRIGERFGRLFMPWWCLELRWHVDLASRCKLQWKRLSSKAVSRV